MKKLLIAVLIALLVILTYFIMFRGFSVGAIEILSIEKIIEANDNLTNKISETNSLLKKDYPAKKELLLSEVSTLLEQKEEYFSVANVSTEGEITKANTEETYLIEYLWVRVGRHAKAEGVNVKMDFSSADTGEENVQNLAFSVTGQYVNIIEFIYAIEDDSELNFKIENYKMVPNEANLTATFNVTNVRVNVEKITTQEETEENSNTNENTQATTDTNNTTNTTVDANTNNTTNDTANTIINDL